MNKSKFIKKENDIAEYEIAREETERVFDENGKEYKAEKVERKWKPMKKLKRKLDKNKVGMFIATVITTTLLIQKIVQAGTIFCLITVY